MAERLTPDICVIGAGSGGLSVAAGASQMGASVVLVERADMGGDCLNTGCVPSKALLAAAHAAQAHRDSGPFGIAAREPEADHAAALAHVHRTIAAIAPQDSVARFEALGVRVIEAEGRFSAPDTLVAGGVTIQARYFVIATGSAPMVPPIPGLDEVPYFTNETIFHAETRPSHLAIVGAGPIGLEMAQAHRRLGIRVTVIEMDRALPKDDPEATRLVVGRLRDEGIDIIEGAAVTGVGTDGDGLRVDITLAGQTSQVQASHLLLAAGRRASVDALGLEAAGVAHDRQGITVDARLRTSNRRIFALGDCIGGLQFTHVAGYQAGIVIRNILFRLPAKVSHAAVPWVTYTDPELAQVGLSEAAAREAGEEVNVLRWPFGENDRAQAERQTDGFAKIVVNRRGRILGATIVGAHAGELILPWVMAVQEKWKIGKMAGVIAPYPTLSEVSKRAAGQFFVPKLFSERTRSVVRFLLRLPF